MVSIFIGSDACVQTRHIAVSCKNCKQSRYPFPAAYSQCCGSGHGKTKSLLEGKSYLPKSFFILSNTHFKSAQSPHVNANSYIRMYASLLTGICTSSYKNLTHRKWSVCLFLRSSSSKSSFNVSRTSVHKSQMPWKKSSRSGIIC